MNLKSFKALLVALVISTSTFSNIYTVTIPANNDWSWNTPAGVGSFLWAVNQSNTIGGLDTINFSVASTTPIVGTWAVGNITDEVFIDGISTNDALPITLGVALTVPANNVVARSVQFIPSVGIITALNITGSSNNFTSCTVSSSASGGTPLSIGGNNNTFDICTVTQNNGTGTAITVGGNGNSISNTSATAVAGKSAIVTGASNIFTTCVFNSANHAVTLTGNTNTIKYSSFTSTAALQNSLWINGGTGSIITKCTFTSSQLHAISIENGGGHTIDSCTVTGISDVGIIARGSGNNTIKNSSVSAGSHNGIGLIAANNFVDSNLVFNNARAGIVVVGGDGNTISNNIVHSNNTNFWMGGVPLTPTPDQAGISSDGGSTTITNNFVYGNAANGILVNETNQAANGSTISNNVIGRDALGNEVGNGWNGIFVWKANGVRTDGNTIVNNGYGTSHATYTMPDRISGVRYQEVASGVINNNFIGTDVAKKSVGNNFDGITLYTSVSSVNITSNTVCYNGFNGTYGNGGGIALRNAANNNYMQSNNIGVHPDKTDGGNNDYGIDIEGCSGNTVGGTSIGEGNIIGYSKNTGNQGCGIWVVLAGATNNQIYFNTILNNTGDGILIERGAAGNTVGSLTQGNIITGNENGIRVWEYSTHPVSTGTTNNNTLRGNSFSCNTAKGISLSDNGNNLFGYGPTSKIVTTNKNETRPTFVSGTAPNNAVVDIYVRDANCAVACESDTAQGILYVATVNANATGAWEYDLTDAANLAATTQVTQANVIVQATEQGAVAGVANSSEFSVCTISCTAPQNVTINGSDICVGGNATLVANSTGIDPTGTYQYYWYLNTVAVGNEILPRNAINDSDIVVNTAGSYIVVASETKDSAVCSNTSPNFTFKVNALPVVTVSSQEICTGDATTFTAIHDSTAGSYLWSINGSGTVVTTSGSAAGDYTVQFTDNNGCVASGTGVLTVNPAPTINFNSTTPYFCAGGSVQVDAGTDAATDPGITVVWNPAQGGSDQITVTTVDYYEITVTDAKGCKSTDGVTVSEAPLPVVILEDAKFCKGSFHTYDAGNSGKNFAWSPNGETTQTITAAIQDTYTVIVTDPLTGCSDQASAFADENPNETAQIEITGDDTICFLKGETTELTVSFAGVYALDGKLEWSNGITDDITSTYSEIVTASVMYTDTFNCVGVDSLKIINLCVVPPIEVPNIFIPGGIDNPVFTPIGNITPSDILNGHMEVYDRWGLKMWETDDQVPSWDGTYNGTSVASGVYFWIWKYKDVTETDYNLNGFVEVLKKN
jgi:parallel beta-helix repeat protein